MHLGFDCFYDGTRCAHSGSGRDGTKAHFDEGTILHEIGHALGLGHEHQSPFGGIQWNKYAVYEWAKRTQNWSPAQTDAQILDIKGPRDGPHTEYDPKSIMHYAQDASLLKSGRSIPEPTELSVLDKKFIAELYPGRKQPGQEVAETFEPPEVVPKSQRCPKGCKMKKFETGAKGYTGAFYCDQCGEKQPRRTPMFGCKRDNYDRCMKCVKDMSRKKKDPVVEVTATKERVSSLRCPKWGRSNQLGNHPLKSVKATYGTYCGKCNLRVNRGKDILRCKQCDYNVCSDCENEAKNGDKLDYAPDIPPVTFKHPAPQCDSGHKLHPYYTPLSGYSCDGCGTGRPLPKGTHMSGCRKCDVDYCDTCIKKRGAPPRPRPPAVVHTPKPKCPRNHPLTNPTPTPEYGWSCDYCYRGPLRKGTIMRGCRSCDWDRCEHCWKK